MFLNLFVASFKGRTRHRKAVPVALAAVLVISALAPLPAAAQVACPPTPGSDGTVSPLTGIVNTYYSPRSSASAGGTTIAVNYNSKQGASDASAGDLLLVIQMQDASINSNNSSSYGDGVSGGGASGSTNLNGTGLYEYVRLVSISGNGNNRTFNIQGAGTGGTLINSYTVAAATTTMGKRTFQVIKVPEYLFATLGSGLTAYRWDGTVGGVLAVDIAAGLNLNGQTISVNGLGFRGGAGRALTGAGGLNNMDYRRAASTTAHASKGEGIAGTPQYVYNIAGASVTDTGTDGYPNGSSGRGAPGTAGGGGTDGLPSNNTDNSGGGGGANCGAGGGGGNSWDSNVADGGFGGAAFSASASRVVMGGGGGAGTTNNGGQDDGMDHIPADGNGIYSSGGAGGGIVMIRADIITGTGTITANGTNAPYSAGRDGGGGGGAGGSVLVSTRLATLSGLSIQARGGNGGNAWPSRSPNGDPGERHGPGGGGGGGAVLTSSAVGSVSVTGGSNGITTTANDNYGATSGSSGCSSTTYSLTMVPGVSSGSECRAVTAVDLASFEATQYANGTLVTWRTGLETNNLGFNIYREEHGKRVRVTDEFVPGSMLTGNHALEAGYSYAWFDKGASESSAYWLEDVGLGGRGTMYGPFGVVKTAGAAPIESLSKIAEAETTTAVDATRVVWPAFAAGPKTRLRPFGTTLAKGDPKGSGGTGDGGGAPAVVQWQLAARPTVKLTIRQPGWYRVSYEDLAGLGFNLASVDPRTIQLFADGQEIAIQVRGEEDGRFGPGDAVEFLGGGVDIATTDARVYWLTAGTALGKRVKVSSAVPQAPVSQSFTSTVESKQRISYFPAVLNGDTENYYGRAVYSRPADFTLTLRHVDAEAKAAEVEVALQGVSLSAHTVGVSLNGQAIGEMTFSSREAATFRAPVAASLLHEGDNVVTLTPSASSDVSLVDYIRVTYSHTASADDNELLLPVVARNTGISISGFTNQQIRVVDVTAPGAVQEYTGTVTTDGPGYAISVAPPAVGPRTLYAFTPDRVRRPDALEVNAPSNWNLTSNGADLVIVTHASFAAELAPLVARRQAEGLRVAVVDIDDVYDEFGYGYHTPYAIRAFLARARASWRVAPRFVLLVGDASYDPRNYQGRGFQDFVPTKLVDTSAMETASDDWLVDFDGDEVGDIAIGRLPASTAEQARLMVQKILTYETAPPHETPKALLVSDLDGDALFDAHVATVRSLLPSTYSVTEIQRSQLGDTATRQSVLAELDAGTDVLYYSGHGSIDLWRGNVLLASDAPGLTNTSRPSVFVITDCLNGYIVSPTLPSLGEALLRAPNGAVAVIASAGTTPALSQHDIALAFFAQLYNGTADTTIGEAAMRAKEAGPRGDTRRVWMVLGDPSMRVR